MFEKSIIIADATPIDAAFSQQILSQLQMGDETAQLPIKQITLFGLKLVQATLTEMADALVMRSIVGPKTVVQFINAHCVNTLRKSADYGQALKKADLLLPDGSGVRIASKLSGKGKIANLNGTDLFPELCQRAALYEQAIFALGGKPGIAENAMQLMQERTPGLKLAGYRDGFFAIDAEDALIDQINESGAAVLLVGLGVPAQEKWIARNRDRLHVPLIMGVGGLFDYYSGRLSRAPKVLRKLGLEWCWRLALEPKRLAGRYLIGNLVFLGHACAEALRARRVFACLLDFGKRIVDVSLAVPVLLAAAPIMLVTGVLIKAQDGGPIFFRQTRIGTRGRPFLMLKFRSMTVDAPAQRAELLDQSDRDSICFKMENDPRVTRVGRFIRQYSIDELPQLINIIRGDMSLVGPRPALADEVLCYGRSDRARLRSVPGLTGIWQTSGRANVPFKRQMAMDVLYVRKKSALLDTYILLKTIPAVLFKRGSY
jgi:exopolysaccharide biosynthesis WecB/TagA/CpsF family protein